MFACSENTGFLVSSELYIREYEAALDLFCRGLTYVHVFFEFYEGPMCINLSVSLVNKEAFPYHF